MKANQTIAQFLGVRKFPYEIKDAQGNIIYSEASKGYWEKREYNANGKETYFDNSNGLWRKREYDAKGNQIYFERSDGFWAKSEYDAKGSQIYFENSKGRIIDSRPKQVELTLAEISSKLNIPLELLRIKE
jgi:hypothetical protein